MPARRGTLDLEVPIIRGSGELQSTTILENASKALANGGSLLIVEKVIRPGNEPSFVKLLDLNMMAIGGKDHTELQYRSLLERAGLHLHQIHETPGPIDVIEARL